ncbi:hypothetical protein B0H67DRAFT_549809 [Lasiosphaeris hirsuta]|uniref:Uncharacterized protein n=1 Tax=Lasiosphaeris hirsuta TaxID=260670 RepID=A0AA40BDG2_9PEZI|nr:hypothetical protein B0H67DRAFT_549809 [Lasiosphaeris hirsuta]
MAQLPQPHGDDQTLKELLNSSIEQGSRVRDFVVSRLGRLRIGEAAHSQPIEDGWEVIGEDDLSDNEWVVPVTVPTKNKRLGMIEMPSVETPSLEKPSNEKARVDKCKTMEPKAGEPKAGQPQTKQLGVLKADEKVNLIPVDTATSPKDQKTADNKVADEAAKRSGGDTETQAQPKKNSITREDEIDARKLRVQLDKGPGSRRQASIQFNTLRLARVSGYRRSGRTTTDLGTSKAPSTRG